MDKVLENLIGKHCLISTLQMTYVGELIAVENGVLTIRSNKLEQFINIQYIIGVNQTPTKTQKKKGFLL